MLNYTQSYLSLSSCLYGLEVTFTVQTYAKVPIFEAYLTGKSHLTMNSPFALN
jgi:hypothetical protein